MRLARATTLTRIQAEDELGLTREERQERRQRRRARRRARRQARREERLERKAEKLRARAERLEEKSERPTRKERRQARRAERRGEAPRYPQGQGYPQAPGGQPAPWTPDGSVDDGSLPPEDDPPWDPDEAELEPAPDGTEGMGWSWPRGRRGRRAVASAAPPPAAPARATAPAAPQIPAIWSPPARMGRHIRVQASAGYRAAVVELKPGLFVVAEIPADVARSEMGFAPLLAPLIRRAASRAASQQEAQPQLYVQQPDGSFAPAPQQERRGLFSAFRRQQAGQAQAQPVAMLPGPVAEPAPVAGPLVVAVPRVAAWADPEDVAGVLAGPLVRGRM